MFVLTVFMSLIMQINVQDDENDAVSDGNSVVEGIALSDDGAEVNDGDGDNPVGDPSLMVSEEG